MTAIIPDTIAELTNPPAGAITPAQYDYLCQGIDPRRVRQLKGMSHVEAWDIRRTLIRIFGFGGFDIQTKSLDLVREIEYPPGTLPVTVWVNGKKQEGKNDRSRWTVIYRAEVRLIVKDPAGRQIAVFEDAATGDSANQPSLGDAHDMAAKTALSQGLKRCAVNLGDQFGLSLYNNGQPEGVVVRSLVSPQPGHPAPTPDDAPPVVGGELDESRESPADEARTRPAERVSAAAQPARREAVAPSDESAGAAKVVADLAARCGDPAKLRGTFKEAGARGLLDVDVRSVVHADLLDQVGIEPGQPVPLREWLAAAGRFAAANGGMSVADAVKAGAA